MLGSVVKNREILTGYNYQDIITLGRVFMDGQDSNFEQERQRHQQQVDYNYAAFEKMNFKPEDKGKFVLLHNGELIALMDTVRDAYILGKRQFNIEPFSIQEIDAAVIDLGFYSRYGMH